MIRPFGEHAVLVEVAGWETAQALATSLAADPMRGVEAAIPALRSVLVELVPGAGDLDMIGAELGRRLESPIAARSGRLHTIPVAYGGEQGPDLADVAEACGMMPDEYATRHAATSLQVMFCGFAPGFAYLGDLPAALHVARLATPRADTPAGSVAVAGSMTGIYPAKLPGGWRIIGRTPLDLFDPHREPPALLAPGDTIRFEPTRPIEP
jgi:KipI family sensor histidine kinase inhibitor